MQYNFEIIAQEVCGSTEGAPSYPNNVTLSGFPGSSISPAPASKSDRSAPGQDLGAIITLLPSMVWSSSVPGLADETVKGYDSEFLTYCIKSGPSHQSFSPDVQSVISLKHLSPSILDSSMAALSFESLVQAPGEALP